MRLFLLNIFIEVLYLVSHTSDRLYWKIRLLGTSRGQFLFYALNAHIDHICLRIKINVPNMLQNLFSGKDVAR